MKSEIVIQGNTLSYEVIGKGFPVLMLHGWGVDREIMKGCLEPVFLKKKGFQRIYPDLPGMGKSKEAPDIKNSDDMLRVINAFVDAVIPEKKFLLAGESYGGLLSRGMLKVRKEDIEGLLLICPAIIPGYRKGTVPPLTVIEEDREFLDSMTETDRAAFTYMNVVLTKPVWKLFRRDIYPALFSQNKPFLDHKLDGAFSFDINMEKITFDKPSLIFAGRQDIEVGFKDQVEKFIDFSRASIVVLDKAGHNLQIEQVKVFEALVSEWLDRVPHPALRAPLSTAAEREKLT